MGRNMLVDGEWRTDIESVTDETGEYHRVETSFRDRIRDDPEARFQPEAGRYHLYIASNCPWAHGTAIVRRLLGLTDAITMDIVDPVREDEGWEFAPEKSGCTPDTVSGTTHLRDVYRRADPEFTGRVTVPVLWDRETETIVNNESIEIMEMLASSFREVGNGVDLYPVEDRAEIDRMVDDLYDSFNNGVYRAGFASTQSAYDTAVGDVFDGLDHWNDVLRDQRYLAGDRLTLADVRMFPTLIRFDRVYHTRFKCDTRFVHQYDALWPYLRDLYQTPGVAETVNMDHIVAGYYSGEIAAVGPDLDYTALHDRDRLPGGPPSGLRRCSAAAD